MEKAQDSPYWLRVGIILVITTMLYNVVEAVVALWAGVEAASIALIEFWLQQRHRTRGRQRPHLAAAP